MLLDENDIKSLKEKSDLYVHIADLVATNMTLWDDNEKLRNRIVGLEAALKDAAELLSDAYADIGRSEYGLGYGAALKALEDK